jgi:hypothetical protein
MDAIRVSASDIDAFRYYLANDDAELADLLAQLRHETPPTEAMRVGTALHTALEMVRDGDYSELASGGYTFAFAIDGEIDLPEIREIKAIKDYIVDDCIVTLVGKVDAIHGKRVDDHKFTSRYDAERFMGSMQWRIYLDVFDADEFRWNVFEGREDSDDPGRRYVITALHQLVEHRYPGMRDDIERELRRFVEFTRRFLPERVTKTEAAA